MMEYFLGSRASPGSLLNLVAPGTGGLSSAMSLRKESTFPDSGASFEDRDVFSANDTVIEICSLGAVGASISRSAGNDRRCRLGDVSDSSVARGPSVFLFPASASCRVHDDSKGSLGVSSIVAHGAAVAGTLNASWSLFAPVHQAARWCSSRKIRFFF